MKTELHRAIGLLNIPSVSKWLFLSFNRSSFSHLVAHAPYCSWNRWVWEKVNLFLRKWMYLEKYTVLSANCWVDSYMPSFSNIYIKYLTFLYVNRLLKTKKVTQASKCTRFWSYNVTSIKVTGDTLLGLYTVLVRKPVKNVFWDIILNKIKSIMPNCTTIQVQIYVQCVIWCGNTLQLYN